ncbi:unnamed protein product, partial [Adineta ricciae]
MINKEFDSRKLEHVVLESTPACESLNNSSSILPPLTQYHVAAEQQESGLVDDDSDRVSLNCEDGSLSSHSLGEHYAMEDILNRSRRPSHQQANRTNEKPERMSIEENEQEEHHGTINALDFSLKLDGTNKLPINRSRTMSSTGKVRALKRKHHNGVTDNGTAAIPTRIFHADAFCTICRKEFCNKYFLKTHLANKHGIFDQQSVVPSISTQGTNDSATDSNLQHQFTVISTLLTNSHEDFSSSPSSDLLANHSTNDDENETELSSLRHEMNGVVAGDDDNDNHHQTDDDDDDDEQDGINSNLPQKLLSNDNLNSNPDNTTDDDEHDTVTHSPANSLDYQQQASSSTTAAQLANLPLTPSSTITNLSRQSSAKLPEDFCDICQKHFCNKYYLRKHRLDVHGVQTDSNIKPYKRIDSNSLSTKQSPPSTTQLSSSFPNVAFSPSSVQQSLGMLLNPIFSPLVQSQTSNSEQSLLSSTKRRHTDSSTDSSKAQFPPSLLTVASDVANAFASQLSSSTSTKSHISTCHLCGKKFQNNDYLQLHLMNKHQITPDIQNLDIQQRTKLSNLINSTNGSMNSNTVKKIKLETSEAPTTGIQTSSSSPIDSISSPNPSTSMPGIVDTYFAAKMADRVSCDICHKQVCNKYFLKTHKLKVHGVASDSLHTSSSSLPVNNSEALEDNSDQQHSRSSIDGSPPQLVVDEMNTNTVEPGVIPSPDALTASVNTYICANTNQDMIDPSSTSVCDICSKSFPTKFFHVHMNNAHGIQQQPILSTNGSTLNSKNQLILNAAKRSLTNGNNTVRLKQTPQVQLRVTCQVCKKELCNKYFLRAHMRNVHNISVDDLRLTQQQSSTSNSTPQLSPSSDLQSSKSTYSLSSNILSTSTTAIPTDLNNSVTRLVRSSSNDNDLNGHLTDSDESENLHLTTTTSKMLTNDNNNNNNLLSMQPFLVESDDDLYKDLFVPCMVYLPCRHRVTKPLE